MPESGAETQQIPKQPAFKRETLNAYRRPSVRTAVKRIGDVFGPGKLTSEQKVKRAGGFEGAVLVDQDLRKQEQKTEEEKKNKEEAEKYAIRDHLTGLYNRRFYDEQMQREILRAKRNSSDFSLLTIDLDLFKQVNDTLGHAKGDEVLKKAADILTSALRKTDIAVRPGGDEFAAILPGSKNGAAVIAGEKVRSAFEKAMIDMMKEMGSTLVPTMSIGVASFEPGLTSENLEKRADKAMYQVKKQGRNQVVPYSPDLEK